MFCLFLFNDPLCIFFMAKKNIIYAFYQSIVESTFIGLIYFFWLLLLHSIAQQDNIITIGRKQFYIPKATVCGALWVYLVAMRLYVYIQYSQDPFFDIFVAAGRFGDFFSFLQTFGTIVICMYLVYFLMILSKAMSVIKHLKKTYRYALALTLFCLFLSLALLYFNGQASQRMDPPLYLSLLALYNYYVIIIGFMYAPVTSEEATGNTA